MSRTFSLYLGALAPKLREQFIEQNLDLPMRDTVHFERDITAINRLAIRGLLTSTQRNQAQAKLFKKIKAALVKAGNT